MLQLSSQGISNAIPLLLLLVLSTAGGILILARLQFITGTRHFILAYVIQFIWAVLGIAALYLPGQHPLFINIQNIFSLLLPLSFLAFTIEFTGKNFYHPKMGWMIILLFLGVMIIPFFLPIFSNSMPQTGHVIRSGGIGRSTLDITGIASLYQACVTGIAMFILTSSLQRNFRKFNAQIILILIGLGLVFGGYILAFLYHLTEPQIILAILGLLVCDTVISSALIYFRTFNIKPVAREYVLEKMEDGLLVFDKSRRLIDINPAAAAFLNTRGQDVLGSTVDQIPTGWITGLDFSVGQQVVEMNSAGGRQFLHLTITKLADNLSADSGHVVIIRDITAHHLEQLEIQKQYSNLEQQVEDRAVDLSDLIARLEEEIQERQQVEKALRINETKYRTIIEQASEPILIIDQEGLVIETNPAFTRLTGRPSASVVGQTLNDLQNELVDSADLRSSRRRANLERLLQSARTGANLEQDGSQILNIHTSDGNHRIVEYTASAINNEFGNMVMMVGRDITDSKKAEWALRESEERYKLVVETSPNGIFLMDLDSRIITANQFQAELFGYGFSQDLIGLHLVDFLNEDVCQRLALEDRDTRWDTTQDLEWVFKRRDNSNFVGEFRTTLIHDQNNKPLAVVGIIRDVTLRKQIEQDLIRLNRSLKVISECNQTIVRVEDEQSLLREICRVIVEQGGYRFAWIGMADSADGEVILPHSFFGENSFSIEADRQICLHAWQEMPDWITHFTSREPLAIRDISEFVGCNDCYQALDDAGVKTIFVLPLIRDEIYYGGLVVYSNTEENLIDSEMVLLKELTSDLVYGIQTLRVRAERDKVLELLEQSNSELSIAYDSTLEGWSHALELRERETAGHSKRVVDLTMKLARKMGLSEEKLVDLRRGALLHDIGKLAIPDHILLKPGKLTDEEWVVMRQHPVFSQRLLANIPYLEGAIDIPYAHHERWDGKGYPNGLAGTEIPLGARIFAIVDVWDALSSDRPYRPAWRSEDILKYIQDLRGKQFDPAVVDAFMMLIAEEKLVGSRPVYPN